MSYIEGRNAYITELEATIPDKDAGVFDREPTDPAGDGAAFGC